MSGSFQNDFKSNSNSMFDSKTLLALTLGIGVGFVLPRPSSKWLSAIIRSKSSPVGPCKMVIVVRSDLSMSAGKIASQCAHAAVGCSLKSYRAHSSEMVQWLTEGQPKIVLRGGPGGDSLLMQLCDQASKSGLTTSLIRDAGKTQVQSGTYTALAIGPGPAPIIDKITGHLKTF